MSANKDRLALIEHLSSIGGEHSDDLRETLDRAAFAIASGMEAEVCSLYLFDPQRERIVLRATVGLDRESVGKVSMRLSEGLVGLVLEQDEPVYVPDAISHPRYKYFPETGEERFHTFLGVPVHDGRKKPLGVLVAQTLRAAQIQQERNPAAEHRRQPGRADAFSFQAARIARDQGERAARIQAPHDRGQPPAQGLRESRRQDASRAAGQDSPPAPGRAFRVAGICAGQRARRRHLSEQRRSSSEVARPQGRGQALRGSARALAVRAGDAANPDGAADARVGPQDLRRPSHDSRRRGVRQPHPRHDCQRLHRRERAVPRDRRTQRLDAGGRGQLPARARDRLPRRRPSRAAPSAAGGKARAFRQADDYRRRRADAVAVDDGQPRQARGDRAAIGRRHLACGDPCARVRNPDGGRRRASDGIRGRGRSARARRQRRRRLRQSRHRDRARLRQPVQALRGLQERADRRGQRADRDPRRPSRDAARQHRAARRYPPGAALRRRGRRPAALGVLVPDLRGFSRRDAAARALQQDARDAGQASGDDSHARYRRRQVSAVHAGAARGQSVPRLALDSHLARDVRPVQGAAPRDSPRRRASTTSASCSR